MILECSVTDKGSEFNIQQISIPLIFFDFYKQTDARDKKNLSDLLLGHNVFTSLLFYQGNFIFKLAHLERLSSSYQFLFQGDQVELKKFLIRYFNHLQSELNVKNVSHAHVRISLYEAFMHVWVKEAESSIAMDALSLQTKIAPAHYLEKPSYLKFPNYHLGMKYEAELHENNKLLFINTNGIILEGLFSNIIFVDFADRVIIPTGNESVLNGIMRDRLLHFLNESKALDYKLCDVTMSDLHNYREAYFINCLRGFQNIKSIDHFQFRVDNKNDQKSKFLKVIKEQFGFWGEVVSRS